MSFRANAVHAASETPVAACVAGAALYVLMRPPADAEEARAWADEIDKALLR